MRVKRAFPLPPPSEGCFPARGVPSRSPAEGCFPARGAPSRSPAEGSRGLSVKAHLHLDINMENGQESRSLGMMRRMPERSLPRDGHLSPERIKRLSLNLKESMHTRFKTACSATNRKMATEIQEFIERRTRELEEEAGLSGSGWARQVSRHAKSADPVERRLQALNRALVCNHPTAEIEEMLADIERGRDLH